MRKVSLAGLPCPHAVAATTASISQATPALMQSNGKLLPKSAAQARSELNPDYKSPPNSAKDVLAVFYFLPFLPFVPHPPPSTSPSPHCTFNFLMAERAFLVQKFARIPLGQIHVIGYSVAGEESLVQIPELNVCFDIGRCPQFALTSNVVCLSHGHMDHVAGLPYYLSQRFFQGMKPGIILLPKDLEEPVETLLHCWRQIERQATPYTLVGMNPNDVYPVRKDLIIRAVATHHGGGSLGFCLINVREKLKPEYIGLTGPELVEIKNKGIEIQYRLEVPVVTYLGDTAMGEVFDHPDVKNAEVLITECTFFEADHKSKAKAGRHLHLDHFVEAMANLKNRDVVLTHISRRTGVRRARSLLKRRLGEERMQHVHILMDFEGATDAGEIDALLQAPDNDKEE